MMRTWAVRIWLLLAAGLFAGLAVACGGSSSSGASTGTGATAAASAIDVTAEEWSMKPSAATATAGEISFKLTNKGATPHELAIAKTALTPDKLPVVNGAVDEKQVSPVGRTANVDSGKSETKVLKLESGKYVLYCNIPAHYGQGMHTALTVE